VLCFERPPAGWAGERGLITAEMVRIHLELAEDTRPFIVAGPPQMVAAMERVLDTLEVPAARRLVERFGPRVSAVSAIPQEHDEPLGG
jgi:ferredoxin-NADP reductase